MLFWFIIIFILGVYAYTRLNRVRRYADLIPGDKPWPVIGNLLDIGTDNTKLLSTLMNYLHKYNNGIFGLWLGVDYFVLLSNPDDVGVILSNTTNLSKSKEYNFIKSWLGSGLLTSSGDKWRHSRKIITPTFHFKVLEKYSEVINPCVDVLVKKMENHADGNIIDIHPMVSLCALDIIAESAMGIKINAQNQPNSEVVQSIYDMCFCLLQRTFSSWKRFGLLYRFSDTYKIEKKALDVISTFNEKVIVDRANILRSKNDDGITDNKRRTAFLDMLLTTVVDGHNLPDQMIRDEVATFIFAGHDTSTAAIQFSIYCLANYPEIQEKAFLEQKSLFGDDKNKHPTNQDFQDMKYLERFIKEVLRVYPSVPLIARKIDEDTNINGTVVPAGAYALIFIYAMNRNPKYFPDPEVFDPDRFLPENQKNKHPYEYVSFSAGPRNCIGQKFALQSIKAILSKVLRNFELITAGPEHEVMIYDEVTLRSQNGVKIKIRRRS